MDIVDDSGPQVAEKIVEVVHVTERMTGRIVEQFVEEVAPDLPQEQMSACICVFLHIFVSENVVVKIGRCGRELTRS